MAVQHAKMQVERRPGLRVVVDHTNFRTVTQTSSIQYIESTPLHQARLMMIRDGVTAAAGRVGYESASQFSREFKRLVGRTPVEEARDMRESFTLSPAVRFGTQALLSGYIECHLPAHVAAHAPCKGMACLRKGKDRINVGAQFA